MSQTDDPGAVKKALRTVTPGSKGHPDIEMDTIGWAIFLGIVILLVPLLPFLVIVWVLTKLFGFARNQTDSGDAS